MTPKIKNNWIWYLVFLAAGFLLGYLSTQFSYFKIEKSIDFLGIATLAATVLLAVYVSNILEPQASAKRIEKDLLIDDVKVIKHRIDSFLGLVSRQKAIPLNDLTNWFSEFSAEISQLKASCSILNDDISPNSFRPMVDRYKELKRLATGDEIEVHDGTSFLNSTQQTAIKREAIQLRGELFRIIALINRHS